MEEANRFESARLRRIAEKQNDQASPEDALKIALGELERGEFKADRIAIILEVEGSETRLVTSNATRSEALWLLEQAKIMVLS